MHTAHFRSSARSGLLPAVIGASALALVLGCQVATPSTSVQTTPASATRVVEWNASDYTFDTPETLQGGQITIRLTNLGHETHHLQLLRLNDGVSFEQFGSALQTEGEAALRFASTEGGPGAIEPHGTTEVTLDLKPGEYAVACFLPGPDGMPHLAKGMLKPLQVTPGEASARPDPLSAATFTLKDFTFEMPAVLPAGTATFKVVNAGPQAHELNVVKLAPGASVQDVLAWDQAPAGPPPFESVGGMNGLSPNGSGYMTLNLQPGAYAAICHIPDPVSGVPHLHLGMIKAFTIPG